MQRGTRASRIAKRVGGLIVIATAILGSSPRPASAATTDGCVAEREAAGDSRVEAVAACVARRADTSPAAETSRPDVPTVSRRAGDGLPLGLLGGTALAGIALGAAGVSVVRRRQVAPAGPGSASLPPPVPETTTNHGSETLVTALIDLADRLPSSALHDEVVTALATVDVHPVVVAAGAPFDGVRMRGVAAAVAPEPESIGTVLLTDRPGYRAGQRLIRLPDVVVQTAGR